MHKANKFKDLLFGEAIDDKNSGSGNSSALTIQAFISRIRIWDILEYD